MNEGRWKTRNGFDNLDKKTNLNAHHKKPHQSVLDDLQFSYAQQRQEQQHVIKGSCYRPQDDGKVDFYGKVNAAHATFAHPNTFKTVFISGDDMVAEEAKDKQKEK